MKPQIKGLLHDHINGSITAAEVIGDLYRLAGRPFPFPTLEDWISFFQNPRYDIVTRFDTMMCVMQTVEALELVGYAYGRQRATEGYRYVEAKFAPQYHTRGELSLKQAAETMYRGLKKAQSEFGIFLMPQLCIGRETSVEVGLQVARLALDFDGEVALDLSGDEAHHQPEKHQPAFDLTFGTKVKRDCHAGEWVAPKPAETYRARLLAHVRTALLTLRCDGVSHAIPLCDDAELVRHCVDHGVRVCGCPLSNERGRLIANVRDLHIDELLDRGVIYTLNADDDLFLPPMETVIEECDAAYNFTSQQAQQLEANVFRGAFHPLATTLIGTR